MLISHLLKCIFIHIPKTGGSSMDRVLQKADPKAIRIINDLPATYQLPKGKHCFAIDLKKYFQKEIWDNYFKFAFIRNPFERLVSWYHMCVQRPDEEYRKYVLKNTINFEDFIKKINSFTGRAEMISYNQTDYTVDYEQKNILDFIGRFENIKEDFEYVSERIGIDVKLIHFNKSDHKHYRNYYSENTKIIVEEIFKKDFDHFNFSY
ncbi:Carbohydrate sulfotransferase, 8-13 [Candidatus Magnetomorum sp. HK-1]|nr:Carbohydrate sulfotransferase, 8-13 [Candidatus Magnetomorum sp. HK-1]